MFHSFHSLFFCFRCVCMLCLFGGCRAVPCRAVPCRAVLLTAIQAAGDLKGAVISKNSSVPGSICEQVNRFLFPRRAAAAAAAAAVPPRRGSTRSAFLPALFRSCCSSLLFTECCLSPIRALSELVALFAP